ncbi:caspase domain-containing protein [Boletus coccyginus]|nr:caspase domain-containing protein [Boletus coccyginus]
MPGCPILSCFPRYKAYTQINTTMWDMRGIHDEDPMSSRPLFPAPPNPRTPTHARQAAPPYPTPFLPLGLPAALPPRRSTPNTHASYHTFPRSTVVPKARDASFSRVVPVPQPRMPIPQPVPARAPLHQPTLPHHSNRLTPHHSRSVPATASRHVHYADDMSQPRSRKISAQSPRVSAPVNGFPIATTPHHLHPTAAQQPIQGHRRRAHSTGPAVVNFPPSQSRKLARASGGHVYSRCTGRKKALCIGINYIGQKRELRGCVNDIKNVRRFLTRQWGFKDGDIVMLMDQTTNPRQMPTRKNMIDACKWLVKDARPHDSLFFHYSGHGGQIPDTNGDETSGFDEVIYPVDYKTAGIIVDDELHQILVKPLPQGCRLTAIFDSCHSGTTLDLPFVYHHNGRLTENHIPARMRPQKMSSADVISFAACRDDQKSAGTVQGGVAVGAMSYAFVTALGTCCARTSN